MPALSVQGLRRRSGRHVDGGRAGALQRVETAETDRETAGAAMDVEHASTQTFTRTLLAMSVMCGPTDDGLPVSLFTTHTADGVANLGMDSKKGTQVIATDMARLPSGWTEIIAPLQADVERWMDNNPDQR